ncbi:penicillin-binding protein 2 [Sphingomonas glacialis]|uniref:Penicillin-binding protein 2 n=2 Tax=Sphingomonas glacialis TaxID=658225 RepID=A0A502FFC8_9SPHN|nr:penicillin-binding protein 2 [Sphingomonas glacialis]
MRQPGRLSPRSKRVTVYELIYRRLMILLLLFVAAFTAVGVRLTQLGFVSQGRTSRRNSRGSAVVGRVDIVDRNGKVLARTFDAYSVGVHPSQLIGKPRELAGQISRILPMQSETALLRELTSLKPFRYIQRHISPANVRKFMILGEPGVEILQEPERIYPESALAAHVLGYADIDGIGRAGLERQYQDRLTASAQGPLQLSIDGRVQAVLELELQNAMTEHSAIGAAGVVLDANTGEVIALASLPGFNPNTPSRSTSDARFNRATQGVYELGSTFKAFTIATALETGVIHSLADRYDARVPLQMGRFRIHDDDAQNRWLTVPEIFAYSSNIGAARIAQAIGADRQRSFLDRLGMLRPVAVDLPERGRPLYPASWGELATMTVGFGHGLAVSPLHLALGYAAVVNGGVWRPATLLKMSDDRPVAGTRVFSQQTSATMRSLLRLVVVHGTGVKANAHGYRVGGKTGTAEKAERGGYNHHALISTFAGAFPIDAPRYVVVVTLDEPKGTRATGGYATAGWVAAPVAHGLIRTIGPMLGVYPDLSRDIDLTPILPLVTGTAAE